MAPTTVTCAVPCTELLAAVTVYGPPGTFPAVNRPEESMLPPPDTLQAGVGLMGLPNWSWPAAAKGCDPFVATLAEAGETLIEARVWTTATLTVLWAMLPPGSWTVT